MIDLKALRSRSATPLLAAFALAASALAASLQPAQAIVYRGAPDLPLAVSMVSAGGGPKHFSSLVLYKELTGPLQAAETAKLQQKFGVTQVSDTFAIFDYAINDVLALLTASKTALPAPAPPPGDAKALALALYAAGTTPRGKWDVGYMLEHMISHPVHHIIMAHIDRRYSPKQNATFHVVLTEMMHDLATAYTATPAPAAPAAPPAAATPAAMPNGPASPNPASAASSAPGANSATPAQPQPSSSASP